jgi:hypothetical protein
MRLFLRLASLGIILITVVLWFFGGMNRGWTQTSVKQMQKDPVTDIEYPVFEQRFLPGIDFLGGGSVLCLVTVGVSFLFPKK